MSFSARMLPAVLLAATMIVAGCCSSPCSVPAGPVNQTATHVAGSPERILSTVPDVRQSTPYSCGAASLQAVLSYWGKDLREDELLTMLNTTGERGTSPYTIVNVSRSLGFSAELRTDVTLLDLESAVHAGIPVIVGIQAWRDNTSPPFWLDDWGDGHYLVVIGMDEKNVYLEDPAMLGTRGVISRDEFLMRWHDFAGRDIRDPGAITYRRLAVFIRGDTPAQYPEFTHVD